jgi:hypothetical protein
MSKRPAAGHAKAAANVAAIVSLLIGSSLLRFNRVSDLLVAYL